MFQFLFLLFHSLFWISDSEDDNIVVIEKKIKIHHFKAHKTVLFKIDTSAFYFDASHFMSELHGNDGKHGFHEPVLKDLVLLLGQKDTVNLSDHRYTAIVASLVNDALERGYYTVYFSGKEYHGKNVINVEYWDKDVHTNEMKHSNFYRPDSDIFMLPEGQIFYYYKPAIKRTVHHFRD